MQIRDAAPEDLEAVRQLLATCKLPHGDLTAAHLKHFLIGLERGDVVGIVGLELRGEAALLRSLAVLPQRRGTGFGAQLVEAIEQRAHQQGAETLYLLTDTAANYFGRRGYERVRRERLPKGIQETEEAARLCPSSAIGMKKRVSLPARKAKAG